MGSRIAIRTATMAMTTRQLDEHKALCLPRQRIGTTPKDGFVGRFSAILIAAALLTGCGAQTPEPRNGADSATVPSASTPLPPHPAKRTNSSPEDALRMFLVAVMESDEATIRRVAVDRAGIEILWSGVPLDDTGRRHMRETG
jgi:hypothetical protein